MNKFVIVDIETTGNSLKKGDRIIQFAAVTIESGAITNTYTTFINPKTTISPFITELTGIDQATVKNAPVFSEVAETIVNLFEGACFVAHNVHFDLTFLQDELALVGYKLHCPVIDTVELSRILMPTLESYKLQEIAMYAGFDHDRPHQADSDALVTAEWFLTLINKLKGLPKNTLLQLSSLSKVLNTDLHLLINKIYEDKSKKNEQLSPELEEVRGIAVQKVVQEKINPLHTSFSKIESEIPKFLEKGFGSKYEFRIEQEEMIKTVYNALHNGDIALIEAEPGFGKTISYLLPATVHSIEKNKPVVIATHTIQQQHQILQQEIPRLEKMFNSPIKVEIVKGKSHYLNIWKFERLLHEQTDNYDEAITKMQILVWLTETVTGDVDELNLSSGGILFWKRLSHEFAGGTGRNPWEDRDFYTLALLRAQSAQVIITNHHFLMADMTGDRKFLPEYDDVIIDEAHNLERNTAQFFGSRISLRQIKYWVSQFGAVDQLKLVGQIIHVLKKLGITLNEQYVQQLLDAFSQEAEDFFQVALSEINKTKKQAGKASLLVTLPKHKNLYYSWERLFSAFQDLVSTLEGLYKQLLFKYDQLIENDKILLEDFSQLLLEFNRISLIHEALLDHSEPRLIWVESDDRQPLLSTAIYTRPLVISDELRSTLYTEKKSIILTSATLTVKNSFSFIMEQLGLNGFPVIQKQYRSSFSFDQVKILAASDLPVISDVTADEFTEYISSHIMAIAERLEGRILVLFTSHEMLKSTYYLIKESGALEEFVLLAQGITAGSNNRLAKQFNRFNKSILFGSYSFWEGFDIGNESISAIIMVRLPFSSPNEPIHHGKAELVKKQGKNAFYDYSLPEAVIRFKQGFGRLVRSNHHKGYFIIFDNRILTSKYRHTFLQSIPKVPMIVGEIDAICEEMEES